MAASKAIIAAGILALIIISIEYFRSVSQTDSAIERLDLPVGTRVNVPCHPAEKVCRINLGDLRFAVRLAPEHVPAMEPLRLSLELEESSTLANLGPILVWFAGRDMEMGLHFFEPDITSGMEAGSMRQDFVGMIPVCSVDASMVWLLNLQFGEGAEAKRFIFELNTRHDAA